MKKIIFFLLILLFSSCKEENNNFNSNNFSSDLRTPEEAIVEVSQLWNQVFSDYSTKGNLSMPSVDNINIISSIRTKGINSTNIDSVAYVVNFVNDNGFAIVRTDKKEAPILALTDSGNIDVDILQNPDLLDYTYDIEGESILYLLLHNALVYNDEISQNIQSGLSYEYSTNSENDEWFIDEKYGPFVQVKWGQKYPFNKFMPLADSTYTSFGLNTPYKGHMPAGCVMIAAAQMMVTNRRPEIFHGLINGWYMTDLDDISTYMDYSFYQYDNLYLDDLEEPFKTYLNGVADMIRLLAQYFEASYSSSGTGAYTDLAMEKIATVIDPDYYGDYRTIYTYSPSNSGVYTAASCGKPMIIRGQRQYLHNGVTMTSGHAWITDGYLSRHKYTEDGIISEELVHMNWGWQGQCDGYFDYGVLDILQRVEKDEIDTNPNSLINRNYNLSVRYYMY